MSEKYPIPIERLGPGEAAALVCERCGFQRQATEDEIGTCAMTFECHCSGDLTWKYAEADKCPGCGKLGWWRTPYEDGACSRVCHLQAEFAATLSEQANALAREDPEPVPEQLRGSGGR